MGSKKILEKIKSAELAGKLYERLTSNNIEITPELLEIIDALGMYAASLETRGKLSLFPEIIEELKKRVANQTKENVVYVTSSVELSKNQKGKLAKSLSKRLGMDVNISVYVDKHMAGGLIIKYQDKIIDLSLDKKITDLRNNLKK